MRTLDNPRLKCLLPMTKTHSRENKTYNRTDLLLVKMGMLCHRLQADSERMEVERERERETVCVYACVCVCMCVCVCVCACVSVL